MVTSNDSQKAEALYNSLHGKGRLDDSNLPEESAVGQEIQSIASEIQPSARFQANLEKGLSQLAVETTQKTRRFYRQPNLESGVQSAGFNPWHLLAWGTVIVLLVGGLGWAIRSVLPNSPGNLPMAGGENQTSEMAGDSGITETPQTGKDEETPLASSPGENHEPTVVIPTATQLPAYSLPSLPNVEVFLGAPFPISPSEVQLYSQLNDLELTPENALAVAQKLGVDGVVYQGSSEGALPSYVVSDGRQWIYFNGSPYRFGYSFNQPVAHQPQVTELTPKEQIAIAENFLKQADLLDFPYQAEYSGFFPFEVVFTPILNGKPVIYNDQMASYITVRVNPQGQVEQAVYDRVLSQPVGDFPILTVEEAWQKLVSEEAPTGVETYEQSGSTPLNIEWWYRIYQVGDSPNLFGYLNVFEPVENASTPKLLSLGSYTLVVPNDDLAQANKPGTFFQVWGELSDKTTMQVAGWQISPFPEETIIGMVEREDGLAFLLTGGERYLLPGLPEDIPLGVEVRVRGIRLSQPEPLFDWSYIETGGGGDGSGGGGGGGGGTLFAEVNLNGPQVAESMPTETPAPVYEVGTVLEGIEGNVYIWIDRYPDGSEERKTIMSLADETSLPGVYELRLQGSGLDGIEDYQSLPVRLWGSVVSQGGDFLVVDVSRFEPVYPGLVIQAWLGTWDLVDLDGKKVLRFTTQDGQEYILASSLLYEQTEFVGFPGDLVVLEGVLFPGQMYAGYPLIEERSGQVADGLTSLEGYEITGDDIPVNEYQLPSFGRLTIEKIELVYRAIDLRFGLPDPNGPALYVQPVWRFSGHYEDGREQVILVQALRDEYLK
jgi:hypothetical protein